MISVLSAPKRSIMTTVGTAVRQLHSVAGGHGHSHVAEVIKLPSWPALALAALSIVSKEWLFRITKQIGERLNSQILIANAWYDIKYILSRLDTPYFPTFSLFASPFMVMMLSYTCNSSFPSLSSLFTF